VTNATRDWRIETISEIGEGGLFVDGDWVETKDQDPDGTVRLTQLADVGVAKFRDRSDRWMREDQAAALGCTFIRPGDVLIARMPEPLGRACIVPASIGQAVTAVDVAVLRVAREDVDPRFVMWALNSPLLTEQIVGLQSGTTRGRISRKNLGTVHMPIPALAEQKQIVEVLESHISRVDVGEQHLSRAGRALAMTRFAFLQGRRQSLISAGAELRPLGSVCETALGKMLDSKRAAGDSTPYLRNINVRWGTIDTTDVWHVRLTEAERVRFSLEIGDLLVCEGGEPGRCAVWEGVSDTMTFQKALHRVRARSFDVDTRFVAAMLEEAIRAGRADRLFTGTTIKHLPQEKLRAIEIPVPALDEQRRVVKELDELHSRLSRLGSTLSENSVRTRALRKTLLQAAFTGQLTTSGMRTMLPKDIAHG